MKYQFCIRFDNIDANSAASKAVRDCNVLLSKKGYTDHTFVVGDNSNRPQYYRSLLKQLIRLFFKIKRGSTVAIQYPLLSINNVFRYFIALLKLKGVMFFCIIHDVESLRNSKATAEDVAAEAATLDRYDVIIVHNAAMRDRLSKAGVTKPMIDLKLFDYLYDGDTFAHQRQDPLLFAGNLKKSDFIYQLKDIWPSGVSLYGPGLDQERTLPDKIKWAGVYGPDKIPGLLSGSFGILWDGDRMDGLDDDFGNYMRFNNPHKLSLYIAAGLPVITCAGTAAAQLIERYHIGIIVSSLSELAYLTITDEVYGQMLSNVNMLKREVASGSFLLEALRSVELNLGAEQ